VGEGVRWRCSGDFVNVGWDGAIHGDGGVTSNALDALVVRVDVGEGTVVARLRSRVNGVVQVAAETLKRRFSSRISTAQKLR